MSNDPLRQRRRLIGIGFVLAFALSTATLIYTGLNVRAPGTAADAQRPGQAAPDGRTPPERAAEKAAPAPERLNEGLPDDGPREAPDERLPDSGPR